VLYKKTYKVDQKTVSRIGSIHTFEINISILRTLIILFQKKNN